MSVHIRTHSVHKCLHMHMCQSPQPSKDIRYFKPLRLPQTPGILFICFGWENASDERHLADRLRAVNPGDSLDPAHRSLFERCRLW